MASALCLPQSSEGWQQMEDYLRSAVEKLVGPVEHLYVCDAGMNATVTKFGASVIKPHDGSQPVLIVKGTVEAVWSDDMTKTYYMAKAPEFPKPVRIILG